MLEPQCVAKGSAPEKAMNEYVVGCFWRHPPLGCTLLVAREPTPKAAQEYTAQNSDKAAIHSFMLAAKEDIRVREEI